jgi:hypothetical protein
LPVPLRAGVDDAVEDGIDVAVWVHVGGGAVFVSGLRAEICTVAGVCASWGAHIGFSSWGVQFVRSSWGVQVRAFANSWFSFSPPRQGDPLGEVKDLLHSSCDGASTTVGVKSKNENLPKM